MRPEIPALLFGVLIVSFVRKEFKPRGGSAPLTRFILGMAMIIGAFIFIGCPTTMLLRLARGDIAALIGTGGFVAGVCGGMFFHRKGFDLGKPQSAVRSEGGILPALGILALIALIFFPGLLNFSEQGFGSFHAPIIVSIIGGMVVGGIGFVSRFCSVAPVRDGIFMKNFGALSIIGGFMVVLVGYNLIFGHFSLGMEATPFSHTDVLWNVLSMGLVGFVAVLAGGCPFRQLVHAGSGSSDAAITVFGMMVGTALVHNLGLASSAAGVSENAPIAFAIATAFVLAIAVSNTFFGKKGV